MRGLSHLQNSKWTAVEPVNRARHFELKALERTELQSDPIVCVMRCVVTRNSHRVRWKDLNNKNKWRKGWFRGSVTAISSESHNNK
jgi:tryptophan-rich hypothetical protein